MTVPGPCSQEWTLPRCWCWWRSRSSPPAGAHRECILEEGNCGPSNASLRLISNNIEEKYVYIRLKSNGWVTRAKCYFLLCVIISLLHVYLQLFCSSLTMWHYSPIKASIFFFSAALNPVLSSSSWDGKRSILEEEFWRNRETKQA